MIRGIAEAIGWFIVLCSLARMLGLVEFSLYLNAPTPNDCIKEAPVQPKPSVLVVEHPSITQLKRDARRLTKTAPYTHSQAIELLARQQGYSTYAAMRAALKETAT